MLAPELRPGRGNTAALLRLPLTSTGARLLRSTRPPSRSARCSAERRAPPALTRRRSRAVPVGISRPGTHRRWCGFARTGKAAAETLFVPVS